VNFHRSLYLPALKIRHVGTILLFLPAGSRIAGRVVDKGGEKHQLQVLGLLKKAACSQKLKNVLASHLDDTADHVHRLEIIFERKKCSSFRFLRKRRPTTC
jgi:hypothetical protein